MATPGRQARWAAALLATELVDPGGLITWNGSDPRVRFEVHRRSVVTSLVGALAETFPVVRALVGADFFAAMAAQAARQTPPRSRLLFEYGAGFPEFIARFEPASDLPYLADVARLEWARVHAWSAADRPAAPRDELQRAAAAGDRLAEATVELHPSVRTLRSVHPAVSIWRAHQGEGELGAVEPGRAEAAIVLRDRLEVRVLPASAGSTRFVDALADGLSIGAACEVAAGESDDFDLGGVLGLLLRHGAVCRLTTPGR